ncbi:MAG: hypothetical protein ACXAB7_19385 [Candidatus Kariarchaeaceae archaeon]|jgi:hypothetical protein
MSSSHDRLKWLGIICSFAILFAMYQVFVDETIVGGDASRLRDEDTSNRDSLLILWEDGAEITHADFVKFDADFRLATLGIGLLLFISIFSTLIIHFSNGGKKE